MISQEKALEEDEEEEDSDETSKKDDKKKKAKVNNYGKIATAIGKMKMANITIAPPDINKSQYIFGYYKIDGDNIIVQSNNIQLAKNESDKKKEKILAFARWRVYDICVWLMNHTAHRTGQLRRLSVAGTPQERKNNGYN